jgi:hypothetical protein
MAKVKVHKCANVPKRASLVTDEEGTVTIDGERLNPASSELKKVGRRWYRVVGGEYVSVVYYCSSCGEKLR